MVRERGGRDDHEVELTPMQQLVGAVRDQRDTVLPAEPHGALVAHVAHGLDLTVRMAREVAHEVRAPVAAADYADTDNAHVTSLVSRSGGAPGIGQHDGN